MHSTEDDRRADDELEARPQTRAEELAEELDIPLEEAEKIAAKEPNRSEDLELDTYRLGNPD